MQVEVETRRPTSGQPAGGPHVVGIGASAGGLEALEHFFGNVPKKTGMAFVVVQHLSPDFKSLMGEILGRRTQLTVHLVENAMLVEPDHIYLIPPKREMIISNGRLLLSERDPDQELALPIDVFFRSLAQDCGSRAIAVVLSGGGSDGSRGIRAVHEAGGLVVVQDTESAQFDGMPRTARDAGVADRVLPPQDMARALIEHVTGMDRPSDNEPAPAEQGLAVVYKMLEQEFGIDFTHYKPSTVTRRIERRLQLAQTDDIEQYVARLLRESAELDILYRDLLIGVTRFFRNEEAFALLEHEVLPELLRQGSREAPFRIWVAGCATGEEAYSFAILLHELTAREGHHRPFKIFATDVHHGSLEQATRGLYDEEAMVNVSPERLERHFTRRGRSYQVTPELRQSVVFARHNVIKDAPFTRIDFVSCRNMLIYLRPPAQQKVLSLFHFALNRGGVMLLGPSETPGNVGRDFEIVDKEWRVYRKYSDRRMQVDPRVEPSLSRPPAGGPFSTASSSSPRFGITPPAPRRPVANLLGTYDTLLDEFMPPSLLVNELGELVHAFGGASRFLRIKDGRHGLDVFEMLDSELKMVLSGAVARATREPASIVFKGVRADGGLYKVSVRRVDARLGASAHVLIQFEAMENVPRAAPPTGSGAMPEKEIDVGDISREQLGVLEAELSYTKQSLSATAEQLEASNEQLQAANEELLASNEELQSTNEELQSVNEELYSVNAEYQRKISDLTELGNDMENLLSSTDIGTIFLDAELKIRKFTPQIAQSFNLVAHDVGRPIETFTYAVDHPELAGDLKRVLATGERVERELRDRHARSYFLRVLPYRAKGAVAGVVLTLIDVSGLKAAEDALFHERYLLNSLLHSVPDAIYFKDARGRFIRTNQAMAQRLGLSDPREAAGKTGFELPGYAKNGAALAAHQQDEVVLQTGEVQNYKLEKRVAEDGAEEWDLVTRLPLLDPLRRVVGIIGIFRSVTEQKRQEEKIKDAVRRRDQFLAMLSHELRNPLSAIVSATALLRNGGRADEGGRDSVDEKVFRVLARQSEQMARLLDDLLEASRVTQNKIELRKRVIDLCTVASDASAAVRSLMESRGVSFEALIAPEPIWVEGDPARLQQVHVNLLNNAAKYTPAGGRVVLELKRASGNAVILVKDNGVGMPREMLETAFDLFVQSNRTLERAEGGIGVGLTLVRGLVEKHGGTVVARSEGEGRGCVFEVTLPLAEPAAEAASIDRPPSLPLGRPCRIAIVEDNADSREMMAALLTRAGFECHMACDGLTGLALLDQVAPHAALVDIGLPGINGLEFARRVRDHAAHRGVYLVAVTGYSQQADREMALRSGFDEHLVKPVDIEALQRLLAGASTKDRSVEVATAEAE